MKPLDTALSYAEKFGWAVFPCRPGLKTPATKNGFKDASTDPDVIRAWWTKNPAANIGIATGPVSGFWALDVDVTFGAPGFETLDALEQNNESLPITASQSTARGGRHYLFKWSEGVRNRGKFAAGLDVRGDGGYILAPPSSFTGHGDYKWIIGPDLGIEDAPAWLLKLIIKHGEAREGVAVARVARPESNGRASPYGEATLTALCNEIATCPPGNQNETLYKHAVRAGSVSAGGSINESYAREALYAAGMSMPNGVPNDPWTPDVVTDIIRRGMEFGARDPSPPPPPRSQLRLVQTEQEKIDPQTGEILIEPTPARVNDDWMRAHTWIWKDDSQGAIKPSELWNLRVMAEHHPAVAGMFYYDVFRDQIMMTKGLPSDRRENYPRPLTDQDETAFAAWLSLAGVKGTISVVAQVIKEIAFRDQRDPLKTYLEGLEWDGVERVDTWLIDYAGTEDTEYSRTIARKFLVSGVARGMTPGAKCDTMLVLEGKQGLKKSTLARILCGDEFFSDQIGDITTKDSSQLIQGKWIIEVPEMNSLNRREHNAVKDFLARREDVYRPPYGHNAIKRERRCVFFGTINPIGGGGYLTDPTGARRFWPIMCNKIDLNKMRLNRDQLWAEAFHMWAMGVTWWIDEDEFEIVREQQEARIEGDPWDGKIAEWVATSAPSFFTAEDILVNCIHKEAKFLVQQDKLRVSKILEKMKVTPARQYVFGQQRRGYMKPEIK